MEGVEIGLCDGQQAQLSGCCAGQGGSLFSADATSKAYRSPESVAREYLSCVQAYQLWSIMIC